MKVTYAPKHANTHIPPTHNTTVQHQAAAITTALVASPLSQPLFSIYIYVWYFIQKNAQYIMKTIEKQHLLCLIRLFFVEQLLEALATQLQKRGLQHFPRRGIQQSTAAHGHLKRLFTTAAHGRQFKNITY